MRLTKSQDSLKKNTEEFEKFYEMWAILVTWLPFLNSGDPYFQTFLRSLVTKKFSSSFKYDPKLSHNLTQNTEVSVSTTFCETEEKVMEVVHTFLKIIVHMFTFR